MPYLLNYETEPQRPIKRRRISAGPTMAGRNSKEPPQDEVVDEFLPMETSTAGQEDSASHTATGSEIRTSDREELIECIKRGQKPTWVPKPSLQALYAKEDPSEEARTFQTDHIQQPFLQWSPIRLSEDEPSFKSWTNPETSSHLLQQQFSPRPRSALHTGDFRSDDTSENIGLKSASGYSFTNGPLPLQSTTPPPWLTSTTHILPGQVASGSRAFSGPAMASVGRQRAPSLGSSFSSCFILRTPTSPLVNAISNSNNDVLTSDSPLSNATDRQSRRRTMPPNSFTSLHMSPFDNPMTISNESLPRFGLRRESTMPEHRHQPRRSLSSFTVQSSFGMQTPYSQFRRPSVVSDSLSRRRTSMVGSFEESILRGRMSSPASKPFDFVAQIGVMGKGDCPPSLKCPAHVSVSFQAVFYNYPTSNFARTIADDAPSPYVGTVDLAQNLKPVQLSVKRGPASNNEVNASSLDPDSTAPENTPIGKALARDALKQKRRSSSPKKSIGGAYRIPQKGQLQIVIKNPNKTAVKLFLVPYDLEGMSPGTKTFVRQKSYTSGPILEGALGNTSNDAAVLDPLKDKSILRYLIHLNFCCPAKNRYYLHDNIRIVFANRVPDGKEKLRNEVQLPEPRYTPYRFPTRSQRSARLSGSDFSPFDARLSPSPALIDNLSPAEILPAPRIPEERTDLASAIPFHLAPWNNNNHFSSSNQSPGPTPEPFKFPDLPSKVPTSPNLERTLSPVQGFLPSTSTRSSPIPWGSSSTSSTNRSFSPVPVEAGNGLLSRQFRNLNDLNENSNTDVDQNN